MKDDAKTGSPKASSVGFSKREPLAAATVTVDNIREIQLTKFEKYCKENWFGGICVFYNIMHLAYHSPHPPLPPTICRGEKYTQ